MAISSWVQLVLRLAACMEYTTTPWRISELHVTWTHSTTGYSRAHIRMLCHKHSFRITGLSSTCHRWVPITKDQLSGVLMFFLLFYLTNCGMNKTSSRDQLRCYGSMGEGCVCVCVCVWGGGGGGGGRGWVIVIHCNTCIDWRCPRLEHGWVIRCHVFRMMFLLFHARFSWTTNGTGAFK